ncbi:MAG: DKNYY domain-containing protein [Bacteroidota bacterium]
MNKTDFVFKDQMVFHEDFLLKGVSSEGFDVLFADNSGIKAILKDVKGVWWFYLFRNKPKLKFLTKDTTHFSIINDDYAKDQKSVYLIAKDGVAIPNSDPDTFQVIEETPYYAKDRNFLYALDSISGLFIYDHADFDTLVPISRSAYITDQDNVYHYGPPIELSNSSKYNVLFDYRYKAGANKFENNKLLLLEKYPDIVGWWHPDYEFEPDLPSSNTKGYHQTAIAIYYVFEVNAEDESYTKPDYTLLRKADVSTFEVLSQYYAKDKNYVFCRNRILKEVDVASFRVISNKLAEDKDNLFFNGYPVDCDKASFEIIHEQERTYSFELVARDKDHLYIDTMKKFGKVGLRTGYDKALTISKKIVDPVSFEILNDFWAKDKSHIYYDFKPHDQADAESFRLLFADHNDWAQDNKHLYQYGKAVKAIDGATFEMLNTHWGKDANHVFSFGTGRIRANIDAATFQVTDEEGGAEDKNHIYSFNNFGELKKKKKK